jgi:signal peptidase
MFTVHRTTRFVRRALDLVLIGLILAVLATVAVARVVPAVTGGATFVVGGGSMEPAIPLGSVVIVTPAPADTLAVGDVVSVQAGEQKAVFTHRIIRLVDRNGQPWIETRGDANPEPDPSIIPATAVIGRITTTIPYAGYAVHLLGTLPGALFVLALAVLVLAAAWLLETLEIDQEVARHRRARSRVLAPEEGAAG